MLLDKLKISVVKFFLRRNTVNHHNANGKLRLNSDRT